MTANVYKCIGKILRVTFSPSLNYSCPQRPLYCITWIKTIFLFVKNRKRWHTHQKMSGHLQGLCKVVDSPCPQFYMRPTGCICHPPLCLLRHSYTPTPFPAFLPSDTKVKTTGFILEAEQRWSGPRRGDCPQGLSHCALVCAMCTMTQEWGTGRTHFYNRCDIEKNWITEFSFTHAVTVPSRTVL